MLEGGPPTPNVSGHRSLVWALGQCKSGGTAEERASRQHGWVRSSLLLAGCDVTSAWAPITPLK